MNFIRENRISSGLKQALDSVEDVQDRFLAAEEDEFGNFSENLTLKIDNQEVPNQRHEKKPCIVQVQGDNPGTRAVIFEVIKAEKVNEGKSKFVQYTLSIGSEGERDSTAGIIEKRYSDFSALNSKLKKKFSKEMEHISFPGKVVIGNFTSETIAQRSRAFEQYLTHIFTVDCLRFSDEFKDFLYQKKIQEGIERLQKDDFSQCVCIMEKYLPVQESIQGNRHSDVVCTLCVLSFCHQKLEDREAALKYAESALFCMSNSRINNFLVPLLHHTIYLCWLLSREKSHLEARLADLGDRGSKSEELLPVILNYTKFDSVWYDEN